MKNLILFVTVLMSSTSVFADSNCGLGKGFKEKVIQNKPLADCVAEATIQAGSEESLLKGNPQKLEFSYEKSHGVTLDHGKNKKSYSITGEIILKPVTRAHHQIPANSIDKR